MVQVTYPELSLPREHVLLSGSVRGQNILLPHTSYSLITLDEQSFGILVQPESVAQTLLEQPLFAVNIMFEPVLGLDEMRYYNSEELFLTPIHTKARNIPVVQEGILAIEAEAVHTVDAQGYILYVCEMVGLERMQKQSLKEKLKQMGKVLPTASSPS